VAVSVANGGVVAGFAAVAAHATERPALDEPPAGALLAAARAAHAACRFAAEGAAAELRDDGQRQRAREQERLEAHFQHLLLQVKAEAQHGRASPEEALARRRDLERERAVELEALWQRYEVRIETTPVAAAIVEAPVTRVPLELCRRNASRIVVVELDAATGALVTPPCEGCGGDAPRPAACHDAMHLLCERCAPGVEGRITCSACRAPRARRAGTEAA
jgi:hypothetical protein